MKEKLLKMSKEIVPYHMEHNAEAEACDLLMEIERLDLLQNYVDESAYNRVCLYLTRYFLIYILICGFNGPGKRGIGIKLIFLEKKKNK